MANPSWLRALTWRLRAAHPGVEIESCASGGGRIDAGILARTHRVWLSDSNDALERLRMQADAALFLDQLLIYRELSNHEPSLPLLEVSIHVTRDESVRKIEPGPIFYSKPDFPLMVNECTTKAVEASSSSILIFACGPGRYVPLFLVLITSSLCYRNMSTSLFLP